MRYNLYTVHCQASKTVKSNEKTGIGFTFRQRHEHVCIKKSDVGTVVTMPCRQHLGDTSACTPTLAPMNGSFSRLAYWKDFPYTINAAEARNEVKNSKPHHGHYTSIHVPMLVPLYCWLQLVKSTQLLISHHIQTFPHPQKSILLVQQCRELGCPLASGYVRRRRLQV